MAFVASSAVRRLAHRDSRRVLQPFSLRTCQQHVRYSRRARCRIIHSSAAVSRHVDNSIGDETAQPDPNGVIQVEEDVHEFIITPKEDGERVDKVLAARYSRSRSYFHCLISDGLVSVDGDSHGLNKSRRVRSGECARVEMRVPEREQPLQPEAIELNVLYEDEHLAIIDKPAGLVMHPAPGNWSGTLAHALAHRYGLEGGPTETERAGIVHRLDKGTSGVLVVARNRTAHDALSAAFAARAVEKEYLAITVGSPAGEGASAGVISAPIGRDRTNRLRMAIVPEEDGGREASSTYQILGRDSRALLHLVRIHIHTGRTHQVRVHMRHCRAPVLGDELYGAPDINRRFRSSAQRPLLHAHSLAFDHPVTGERVSVRARLPDDFRSVVVRCIDSALLEKHPEF